MNGEPEIVTFETDFEGLVAIRGDLIPVGNPPVTIPTDAAPSPR